MPYAAWPRNPGWAAGKWGKDKHVKESWRGVAKCTLMERHHLCNNRNLSPSVVYTTELISEVAVQAQVASVYTHWSVICKHLDSLVQTVNIRIQTVRLGPCQHMHSVRMLSPPYVLTPGFPICPPFRT